MKKNSVVIFLWLLVHGSLFSQKEIISTASGFIVNHDYSGAQVFLDSILNTDSNNIDALMMKGNVILNRATENLPPLNLITENDESIFFIDIQENDSRILPADTVYAIEKFWLRCLQLDSTRNDIRKGLCTIYSMAVMTEELKREIASLVHFEKDEDGGQAFRTAEYARKIKERGQFKEAMSIYQFIATQFPSIAGLRCDIASEYFYEGKMNEALAWLDSCFNFKSVDETSFLNGAFVYSQLGYFDDAQNVLNTYSHIYDREMDEFYYGLRLFSDSSDKYIEVLEKFIDEVDTNAYSSEVDLAKTLLRYKDSFLVEDYRRLTTDNSIPDYYKVLIHTRAIKQFKQSCEPYLLYGVYHTQIRNYFAAVQFLEEGEHCDMNNGQRDYWELHYAYALYMHGDYENALRHFRRLYKSLHAFYGHSAKYFSAKILVAQKRKDMAEAFWKDISTSKEKTKYVELAERQLK